MMWTAADPKTAGDKSRPWAFPADNHSVLLRAGPHMPGRAASSKISLPHTHPSSQSCRGGCDDIIHKLGLRGHGGGGVSSPRSMSWRVRNQDDASWYFWVIYCLLSFSSILSTPSPHVSLYLTLNSGLSFHTKCVPRGTAPPKNSYLA